MDMISTPCMASNINSANSMFGTLVQTILAAQCALLPQQQQQQPSANMWPNDYGPIWSSQAALIEYDFIVVGGGTSGSVVASRLSENPNNRVLLLEAGDNPPIESEIPGLAFVLRNSTYEWKYFTERSNKTNKGLQYGINMSTGKVLGGSSAINNFIYSRGFSRDYDNWLTMGNLGWDWASVLADFQKIENMKTPIVGSDYGINGPVTLDTFHANDPIADILKNAAAELGFQTGAVNSIGLNQLLGTFVNGTRCSSAKAFLIPAANRPNLHIIKNAEVTKILFDTTAAPKSKTTTTTSPVIGVEFMLNQQPFLIKPIKEVVLTAGAINTAHLLMRSGIGPGKYFKKANMTAVNDLAVGKNLQDHVLINMFYRVENLNPATASESSIFEADLLEYLANRTGSLTRFPLVDVTGFFNSVNATDVFPDVQIYGIHFRKGEVLKLENYLQGISHSENISLLPVAESIETSDVVIFNVMALNPMSSGKIKFNFTNPIDPLIVEANYLKKKEDLRTLVRGIRLLQNLQFTQAFRQHRVEEIKLNIPECGPYLTDLYWECYVRHMANPANNFAGSARMGPATDKDAVVDERLLVRGTSNLRIADASIMPTIVSGHIMGPVMMIGERAARFIQEDWLAKAQAQAQATAGGAREEL